MSKLDDIYNEIGRSYYWEGTVDGEDDEVVTEWRAEFKQQIKDLMLELVDDTDWNGRGDIKAELLQKVNEL